MHILAKTGFRVFLHSMYVAHKYIIILLHQTHATVKPQPTSATYYVVLKVRRMSSCSSEVVNIKRSVDFVEVICIFRWLAEKD